MMKQQASSESPKHLKDYKLSGNPNYFGSMDPDTIIYTLACLSVYIWTNQVQILCATSHDPKEGLWMLKITKICVQKF